MHGEIITIGNELVSGRTQDLNSWYAAGRLTASGLKVTRVTSVGDDEKRTGEALKRALNSSRFVIVTGGLGSTTDDMTCEIAANALDCPLCLDHQMLSKIEEYVRDRKIQMTESLKKMARMPKGARMINPKGATCGFSLVTEDVHFYFLPGVPDQTRYLIDTFVLPDILGRYETLPVMRQRIIKVYGLDEPRIAEIFNSIERRLEEVVLGFYPHFPENHITISLRGRDEPSVSSILDRAERIISEMVGPYAFTHDSREMEEVVGHILQKNEKTLSVAESCTGGLIGTRLTDVAGSSRYFQGGVVSYSNQAKIDFLRVSRKTIESYGAVSAETAREMAMGVRSAMHTDIGLAVTGIAGPDGGSRDKPVGTVHIALSSEKKIFTEKYRFWGKRKQVKLNSAMMALDWVRRYLNGDPFISGI
ncbi:MAG: CinA family nicotinamide mononucleotide deamidase-related protein [Deltaproteobacteria bacterium]|nr:CinA family nicotinamide mononucleotide deamidase-related protein [Deltaproteobacteria bacterium]